MEQERKLESAPFMRFQTLLFGVRFFTILSFGAWMGVFFSVDPESAGMAGVGLFLGVLFSFLTGFLTLLIVSLFRRFLGDVSAAENFGSSFRQGFLLAVFSIATLVLLRLGYLSWWNGLLLFAAILLVELTARWFSGKEH